MPSILFSDDNKKLVSPKEAGVSVSVLSVMSMSVFAFFEFQTGCWDKTNTIQE